MLNSCFSGKVCIDNSSFRVPNLSQYFWHLGELYPRRNGPGTEYHNLSQELVDKFPVFHSSGDMKKYSLVKRMISLNI